MKRILIISDGKPGHLNQSIAFCKIKKISYDIVEINFKNKILKGISYIADKAGYYSENFFKTHKQINYEFYDAVVSTGSSTYYFTKYISKKYKLKSIVLMLPKSYDYEDFTYIVAQKHDNPPKLNNLIEIPLNLSMPVCKNYISKDENKKAIGIVIGGPNEVFNMNLIAIKNILEEIKNKHKNEQIFITTSRRTPSEIEELIEGMEFDFKLIYSKEPSINPIGDFIEKCDEVYITIDSTSMISEVRANSDAKLNIIDLESEYEDTKYHKLVNIANSIDKKLDFEKLLEKVEI